MSGRYRRLHRVPQRSPSPRFAQCPLDVGPHGRVLFPVASDEPRGLLPVDARLESEPVAGHPVDDAVVERLADAAHLGGDFIWPHTVEAGGGEGDVLALRKASRSTASPVTCASTRSSI